MVNLTDKQIKILTFVALVIGAILEMQKPQNDKDDEPPKGVI